MLIFKRNVASPPPLPPHLVSESKIKLELGEYFLDGPIFVKSGVTLSGMYSSDSSSYTELVLYDGANNENAAEEAIIVIADVTGAEVGIARHPASLNRRMPR